MTRITSNGSSNPTDKINGCAHEWVGYSVATGEGSWKDRQGGITLSHSIENFTQTNGAVVVDGTTGVYTSAGFLKSPKAGQKLIAWVSGNLSTGTQHVRFGTNTAADSLKIGRPSSEVDQSGIAGAIVSTSFTFIPAGDDRSYFMVIDAESGSMTCYDYNDSGVLQESVAGLAEANFVNRQISFDQSILLLPSSHTGFSMKSLGLIYLDVVPDNIQDLLSWMAQNPTLGCHDDLRYVD